MVDTFSQRRDRGLKAEMFQIEIQPTLNFCQVCESQPLMLRLFKNTIDKQSMEIFGFCDSNEETWSAKKWVKQPHVLILYEADPNTVK